MEKHKLIIRKKIKLLFLTCVTLILLNTIITFYNYNSLMSFKIDNSEFYFISIENEELLLEDQGGEEIIVRIDKDASSSHFYPIEGTYTIKYKDEIIKGSNIDENGTRKIRTSTGSIYTKYKIQFSGDKRHSFDVNLAIEIEKLYSVISGYGLKSLYVSNTLILLCTFILYQPIKFSGEDTDNRMHGKFDFTSIAVWTFFITVVFLVQMGMITYHHNITIDIIGLYKDIIDIFFEN